MRPTGFEPATFGLKDRRSLGPRKDPLTAELRAPAWKVTRAAGFEHRRWGWGLGMELGLEGRVALVMGASRGIGRGIAAALARGGARGALVSRWRERLEEAAAEIGEAATTFVADATDLERLARLPLEVAEALGSVDV